jgi:hypothetical protein
MMLYLYVHLHICIGWCLALQTAATLAFLHVSLFSIFYLLLSILVLELMRDEVLLLRDEVLRRARASALSQALIH